jgi:hypothetical protein
MGRAKREGGQKRSMSVRVTAEQEQALQELAKSLTATNPQAVALHGESELSAGAVLKMVVARGIASMQADMKRPATKPKKKEVDL